MRAKAKSIPLHDAALVAVAVATSGGNRQVGIAHTWHWQI